MKYPYQPEPSGRYALAVIGNLGFAWDEEKKECLVALLLDGTHFESTYEGIKKNRREYQTRTRQKAAKQRRVTPVRGPSQSTEAERAVRRARQAARRAQEKEWRAADKIERAENRARRAKEPV